MMDERLDSLSVSETKEEYDVPIKISRVRLVNYKFFHGEFVLPVGGENPYKRDLSCGTRNIY